MDGLLFVIQFAVILLQVSNVPDFWKIMSAIVAVLSLLGSILYWFIKQQVRLSRIETVQRATIQRQSEQDLINNEMKVWIDGKMDKTYCTQTMQQVHIKLDQLHRDNNENTDKIFRTLEKISSKQ